MAQLVSTVAHDEDIGDYAVVTLIALTVVSVLGLVVGMTPAADSLDTVSALSFL